MHAVDGGGLRLDLLCGDYLGAPLLDAQRPALNSIRQRTRSGITARYFTELRSNKCRV
jgi:hypothetical protein